MHIYLRYLFTSCAFLLCGFSYAADLTGEESSLEELRAGRIPFHVSSDGNWLVHLDGDSILHRTKVNDANIDQKIMLFNVPLVISSSHDAQKIALFDGGCIRLASFGEDVNSVHKIKSTCTAEPGSFNTIQEPGDPYYGAAAVAISKDAKQLAFARVDSEIHIIDLDGETLRANIPTVGTILHIRFLDEDTKLLVVQATMGEVYEENDRPSDMQFAVWDLKKRELISFFHSAIPRNLATDDFLWSFSELSGELTTIKPESESRLNREKNAPISISRFNLKKCNLLPAISFVVKGDQLQGDTFLEMTSDPAGRWLATIEANTLIVRSLISGEVLHQEKLAKVIRSLSPSTDGSILYGVEAGELLEDIGYYRGGGKVVQFPLDEVLAGLPEPKAQNWNENICKIENEAANVRHIEVAEKQAEKLYKINLGVPLVAGIGSFQPKECYQDLDYWWMYENGTDADANRWGLSEDGRLWIDRDKELEELNPLNGKHVRNISTPRTETLCSFPIFAKQKFLNLGGDKVLAIPFFKEDAGKYSEFARLDGTEAKMVVKRGENVGILWQGQKEEITQTPILYNSISGKMVKELPNPSPVDYPSFDYLLPISELTAGSYRWDVSFMGSVRAQFKSPETSQVSTVLWDGLSFGQEKPKQSTQLNRLMPNKLVNLGGGKAVLLKWDSAVFYDATSKRKLAAIPLEAPIDAQWSEKDHLLFIETMPVRLDDGGSQWYLHAYKID